MRVTHGAVQYLHAKGASFSCIRYGESCKKDAPVSRKILHRYVVHMGSSGTPSSVRVPRVPTYSFASLVPRQGFRIRDYHPLWFTFPSDSTILNAITSRATPISLAATLGISVDFFSSGY